MYYLLMFLLNYRLWLILSLIRTIILIFNIKNYKKERVYIENLVNKCTECTATIIKPVVLKNFAQSVASDVFSGFKIRKVRYNEYYTSQVLFHINDKEMQTFILRKKSFRMPEYGDEIEICYDPDIPERAFAENMKEVMLNKPRKDFIISLVTIIVCILCAVVIKIFFY
ncbi:MAG: hypothetical protein K2K16_02990 [Ruminococcus sp.]|nr:hypothetical protein [Ruminococcus sp.]